ncbi:SLBB domain-containing protein [Noviherbaspirillum sedimenti]|nr:SLBB domain-containing protein [Noviherbaspirillum sedimenti]
MNKNSLPIKPLVKFLCAACVLGTLSSSGWAQSGGRGATGGMEMTSGGGLPTITNRADQRQLASQVQTRPAKATGSTKDSFEAYVETVTGGRLAIYGKDLFGDVPTTFAPIDAVQVNPDYVIGTGDELQIRGWGMVEIDVTATVDRSGAIYIPQVGAVKVAGVKYRDLQDHLKKAIGKIFSNFELTASIAQTRALQIYVVGHAVRPGTYTLSAMSTLLNALFVSGGPDASGSMRNIQVKRGAETVTTFDLYDMLSKGDKSRDISLRDGDVIYIPEVGPLVALTGNVKKPGIFELKGTSSVADLLALAGGVDSSADQKQIIVEKNVDNQYQTVAKLLADKSASGRLATIPVRPTDILRVFSPAAVPVQVQIQNEYVRVAGEVKQSGVFPIKKGETLRELIARLGGATENGYVYATQLKRESVRRIQQAKLDEVATRFERELESVATQRLAGTTDKDNVATISAEIERQRRLAQQLRAVKAEGRIVLELPDGEAQVKHLPDLALQDGDSIYIPRKPGTVDVLGSVFQQNAFIHKPRRSVSDYLTLAGGPTASGDTSEMYVIRADGTAQGSNDSWFSGVGGAAVNPGDTIVVPEKIDRTSWRQSLKEWTAIFFQFGLGAAGLKVLKD